jgi:hypothetical protein
MDLQSIPFDRFGTSPKNPAGFQKHPVEFKENTPTIRPKHGASEGTRTLDHRFTKPELYQLSHASLVMPVRKGSNIIRTEPP